MTRLLPIPGVALHVFRPFGMYLNQAEDNHHITLESVLGSASKVIESTKDFWQLPILSVFHH